MDCTFLSLPPDECLRYGQAKPAPRTGGRNSGGVCPAMKYQSDDTGRTGKATRESRTVFKTACAFPHMLLRLKNLPESKLRTAMRLDVSLLIRVRIRPNKSTPSRSNKWPNRRRNKSSLWHNARMQRLRRWKQTQQSVARTALRFRREQMHDTTSHSPVFIVHSANNEMGPRFRATILVHFCLGPHCAHEGALRCPVESVILNAELVPMGDFVAKTSAVLAHDPD